MQKKVEFNLKFTNKYSNALTAITQHTHIHSYRTNRTIENCICRSNNGWEKQQQQQKRSKSTQTHILRDGIEWHRAYLDKQVRNKKKKGQTHWRENNKHVANATAKYNNNKENDLRKQFIFLLLMCISRGRPYICWNCDSRGFTGRFLCDDWWNLEFSWVFHTKPMHTFYRFHTPTIMATFVVRNLAIGWSPLC